MISLNPQRPRGVLLGVHDNLHEFLTSNKIAFFYLVYYIESIYRTIYQTEDVKMKSYVTTVTRYMWYVFESRSFYMSSNPPINHSTCMYAPIRITIFNPSAFLQGLRIS